VVEYAHQHDVTVEGELGVLAGIEDEVSSAHHTYTQPEEVEDFVAKTGVDSLAISIGTSHGAFKFKPGEDPKIRLDILQEIEKEFPVSRSCFTVHHQCRRNLLKPSMSTVAD